MVSSYSNSNIENIIPMLNVLRQSIVTASALNVYYLIFIISITLCHCTIWCLFGITILYLIIWYLVPILYIIVSIIHLIVYHTFVQIIVLMFYLIVWYLASYCISYCINIASYCIGSCMKHCILLYCTLCKTLYLIAQYLVSVFYLIL